MSGMTDWMHMTHDQIYEAVHRGPGGGAAMLAEDAWRDVREIIVAAEQRTHSAIAASTTEWEGGGAEAARAALSTLNDWVLGAIDDARTTLYALTEQGFNAESFRRTVPPPHAYELFEAQSEAQANPNSREAAERAFRAESTAQDPVVQAMGDRAKDRLREYVNQSYANLGNMSFWSVPPVVTVDTSPVSPAGTGGGPGPAGPGPVGGIGGIGGSGSGIGTGGVAGVAGGAGLTPVANVPVGLGGATGGVVGSGGVGGSGARAPISSPAGVVPVARGDGLPGYAPGVVPGAGTVGVRTGGAGAVGGGPERAATGGAPVALAPGAGGRGVRPVPEAWAGSPGGVRPVLPRAPSAVAPSPSWRDLVTGGAGSGQLAGSTGGRPGGGGGGPGGWSGGSGGGGTANPAAPRGDTGPRLSAVGSTVADAGRGGSAGGPHGLYPPMAAGAGGGQGQERRRAPFLIDDSGVFDVDVPYTDPVIGGELPAGPPREA